MYKAIRNVSLLSIVFFPFMLAIAPIFFFESTILKFFAAAFIPIIYASSFLLTCIAFARFGVKSIVPGKFPRDVKHEIYGPRSVYGSMWTAIFYFKPLYWLILSNNTSKKIALRGFGYKGSLDVTFYPDTWIRDLPLLILKSGAYLANRATIGTNMVLKDGKILVNTISVGERSVVGHLAVLACGSEVGDFSEIGSATALGIRTRIGNRCNIGPRADINHGAYVADSTTIGACSYLGIKSQITTSGIRIPPHSCIPGGTIISSQEEVKDLIHSESAMLAMHKHKLGLKLEKMI
ncbi:MAG: hypothetical protein EOP04_02170 [Proteobacteria bacterium]|nr:MAG: hypothetical protein EOP04_02170 [Pseudomonadota bacterium]